MAILKPNYYEVQLIITLDAYQTLAEAEMAGILAVGNPTAFELDPARWKKPTYQLVRQPGNKVVQQIPMSLDGGEGVSD